MIPEKSLPFILLVVFAILMIFLSPLGNILVGEFFVPRRSAQLMCGNGVCDMPGENTCTCPLDCGSFCGDNCVNGGEECDDGDTIPDDGCNEFCEEEYCGDNITQPALGEQCDGTDDAACLGEVCLADCTCDTGGTGDPCGDEIIDPSLGEQCDDGGQVSGDGCSDICEIEDGWGCWDEPSTCGSGCNADDARQNTGWPFKGGYDFIPFGEYDQYRIFEVYSLRDDTAGSGNVNNNVGIFLIELSNGDVAFVGSGYGNFTIAHDGVVHDMNNVEEALMNCMGKSPADTTLFHVATHAHPDHTDTVAIDELQSRGWVFTDILFHDDDYINPNDYWKGMYNIFRCPQNPDCNLFYHLDGTTCHTELVSLGTSTPFTLDTPYGKMWFTWRGGPNGHTPGSIDIVIDVENDPTQRFLILGSAKNTGSCTPVYPPRTRRIIAAHGNACTGGAAFLCNDW